ncbi:hypothetical protein QYE76_071186 [Lolium multiflorum]|uniref:Reverse transcriptase/retrotransposon-derived protein RNase H-like domain-containing protein n=1 Tax=Lolium multiflorum TaxID=4521 RepID=A0AAD8SL30_LOLMU|nr:hypothetical protein QYE76_071186 [Lolium multiflorum]
MGRAESAFATRCRLLETNRERTVEQLEAEPKPRASLVGVKNATTSLAKPRTRPEPRRSRNEERDPEPRRAGTTGAASARRRQPREPEPAGRTGGEYEAGGGRIGPLADLPHHHLAVATEVEAEVAGDLALAQNPRHGSRDARERLNEYNRLHRTKVLWQDDSRGTKAKELLKLPGNLKHYDGTERIPGLRTTTMQGTYKRPATASDLQACIQKKGESSRNFLTRWLACRNECDVDHTTAMYAFIGGLQRGGLLRHKLTCLANANKLTLDEMISIASDHTAADDDAAADPTWSPWRFNAEVREAEEDAAVAAELAGSAAGLEVTWRIPRPQTYEEYRDILLATWIRFGEVHTHQSQLQVGQRSKERPGGRIQASRKHRPRGKGGKGKNKDKDEDSSEAMEEDDNSPDPKSGTAGSLAVLARRHSLYKLLKKADKFVWDEAADAALQGLKEILTSPPILAAPGESEPMLLYLAATNRVISLVIVVERQEEVNGVYTIFWYMDPRDSSDIIHDSPRVSYNEEAMPTAICGLIEEARNLATSVPPSTGRNSDVITVVEYGISFMAGDLVLRFDK